VFWFFFSSRRRHTRFSRDWSSDVCSSDLGREGLSEDQLFQIGAGLFEAGRYDGAVDAFRKAVALNPFSRDAHFNLAQSLYQRAQELQPEEGARPEEHTSELQSRENLVCRLLLEKKNHTDERATEGTSFQPVIYPLAHAYCCL